MHGHRLIATLTAIALSGLAACGNGFLSGAGSMQIEVEVYKGPLAKDPWTQWGELVGYVNEATTALLHYDTQLALLQANLGCPRHAIDELHPKDPRRPELQEWEWDVPDRRKPVRRDISELSRRNRLLAPTGPEISAGHATQRGLPFSSPTESAADRQRAQYAFPPICTLLFNLEADIRELVRSRDALGLVEGELATSDSYKTVAESTSTTSVARVRTLLSVLTEVLTKMQGKALLWTNSQLSTEPPDPRIRGMLVNFAALTAEYANQIATRSDALLQQIDGPDRRELPLSLYIRNTNPTDYLNLYVWNHATDASSRERATDRVRGIERLYSDANWSKINTVYASGQGDVAMAFIKDDIGNWNLKSFDNDPEQLLNAYKNVGLAALSATAQLAGTAATGGGGALAQSALSLANQVALGQPANASPTVAGLDVAALHQRAEAELRAIQRTAVQDRLAAQAALDRVTQELAREENQLRDARQAVNTVGEGSSSVVLEDQAKNETDTSKASKLRDRARAVALLEANVAASAAGVASLTAQQKALQVATMQPHRKAVAQALEILQRHQRLLDLMQDGVARTQSGVTSAEGATTAQIAAPAARLPALAPAVAIAPVPVVPPAQR